MLSVRRKIALQVVVSNLSTVVNFALAVILARLLSPDDIGVFSMSAVLIAIAHTFRDFGVTTYLKREKDLTDQTIRTARGLLYLTSWSMALAMFFSAGFWAGFFNEPRVEDVVHVLALGFIFIPFGAIAQAVMTRELNVVQSAKVAAVSTTVYFFASVCLALLGFKHMTMAWANLINILIVGLAYNFFLGRRLPWMPSMKGWRSMVSFGTANVLTSLCKVLNTSIPDLLLGRLSVASDVGLFSRATSTVNMVGKVIEPSISYFTLPYMARIHHTTGNVSGDYLRASSIINSVLLPVLVWVALMAHDIVSFLFGEQWLAAVPAIPWLCAATGIATLFSLSAQTVTSVGRPFAALPPLVLLIAGKLLAVYLLYDGSLKSFAIALLIGEMVSAPAYIYLNRKLLRVHLQPWAIDVCKTLLAATVAGVALAVLLAQALDSVPILVRLLITFPFMMVLSVLCFEVVRLPIANEIRNATKSILMKSTNE
ncbi:oligosaccharide flippase family protein [Hydrogenophaga sp.]|uniref:oligosaccharide flippase family protein n=1 Tax=Hydrogenophaga sp. TaxID=1904254 RepID=UPI002731CC70|nr:oligosaccharide flippase family protein [Hydrogenophaga sp.]MDP2073783.1 oligosaccharide flippase family protein [Hydrogenophaga sp.]MDP3106907.1 oligosaccharide flippase family protein [Hydrogenophaga sp.]